MPRVQFAAGLEGVREREAGGRATLGCQGCGGIGGGDVLTMADFCYPFRLLGSCHIDKDRGIFWRCSPQKQIILAL